MADILLTTLGTWQILPELLGFTNPDIVDIFRNHPQKEKIRNSRRLFDITPVDEVWVVSTSGQFIEKSLKKVNEWYSRLERTKRPVLKIWQVEGTEDLSSEDECRKMSEAIHTMVHGASQYSEGGKLFLSLTGGRKTMSTDLQKAAAWFGCQAMIHVVDNPSIKGSPVPSKMDVDDFLRPIPAEYGELITPFVVDKFPPNPVLSISKKELPVLAKAMLQEASSDLLSNLENPVQMLLRVNPDLPLTNTLDKRQSDAGYLMCNYTNTMLQGETVTNFLALYSLPEDTIKALKNFKMGCNPEEERKELQLIEQIPKAELHCHLGGVADVFELIRIAKAAEGDIRSFSSSLNNWLNPLKEAVRQKDASKITFLIKSFKDIRQALPGVPAHITTASFILIFKDNPELLDEVIYGDYRQEECFCGIEFDAYERTGDLQGSGLLTHPSCLREACRVIAEKAIADNVIYLELRCSPVNYASDSFPEYAVYETICNTLEEYAEVLTCSIIFIASRHGEMAMVNRHVELACRILEKEAQAGHVEVPLRGFDLAGNEGACSAAIMQKPLMPVMEKCLHFTIHAGENHPPQSIWEAVYLLNAERIGHCLTLKQNLHLMERFLDRNIVLEMCPSSNFQIIGYRDNYIDSTSNLDIYPLQFYLEKGLRVTVNTDNPGISRTIFSKEIHRACRMTPGGLSMWEILSIVRNSFKASFAPRKVRHRILRKAEEECVNFLKQKM
ncbi:putative Adenosine deaminase [Desulfamplus magnetovallimortis]|uniref:adenosine deaminase n=1 Tax=Desulfamplus magnetovallimortis TaxID=1246637 RepID=A0A1W1H7J9_9BACT|nr:CRISPR-associated ring nuclease [Desulfamplus magnetovallimortis]SLM28433.1 putative Adenosine deaminase [Desulfamplus magnetovallimortis]